VRWPQAWEWRESSASKDVNMETDEAMELVAVTRRQPVRIKHTEKTLYVL
jgi:hypothetical protein